MKKFFYSAVALLLSVTYAGAQLKNSNGNATLAKIKTANEKVTTMSCSFTRTIKQSMLDQSAKADGNFNYTKDNKLSMVYTNGEMVVINNNEVAIGKKGKVRHLKAKSKHAEPLVNTLLGCVSGNLDKLDGTLESVIESKGVSTVIITVDNFKVGQSKFSKVELNYGADLTIQSIKMTEADGSYTLYELQSKTLNKSIDDKVYNTEK